MLDTVLAQAAAVKAGHPIADTLPKVPACCPDFKLDELPGGVTAESHSMDCPASIAAAAAALEEISGTGAAMILRAFGLDGYDLTGGE